MARILLVEDEADIALGLRLDFEDEGHAVEIATDGETGSRLGRTHEWDLIILDVMLPKRDGLEVCRDLRRAGVRAPILLLTARAQEAEKVLGLDMGADDYVTKPFGPRELRARVRALLRRTAPPVERVHRFGDCEVDVARAELRRDGRRMNLTAIELKMIDLLVGRAGHVVSRARMIEEVWGPGVFVTDRVVDAHIVNIRRKVEPDPTAPRYVVSVRGLGYRFDA